MSLNQNSGKTWDYVQAFGPQLNIFYYVVLVHNVKNEKLEEKKIWKIVTSLAYIFTM